MTDISFCILPSIYLYGPGIGSALLKAVLEEKGYRVTCYDFNIELFHHLGKDTQYFSPSNANTFIDDDSFDVFFEKHVKEINEVWADRLLTRSSRWIGLYSHCYRTKNFVKKLAESIKRKNPLQKIVLGGPYAEYIGKDFFQSNLIDCWVVGEAEEALCRLLSGDCRLEELHPLRSKHKSNMEALPVPDYSDFDFSLYPTSPHSLKEGFGLFTLFIEGSRSCVRRCNFCDIRGFWGNFRTKSGKRIAQEMISLYEKHGIPGFFFTDSLINGSVRVLSELCRELIKYQDSHRMKRGFKWHGNFIIYGRNRMPEYIFDQLKEAGCYLLKVGVESGSERVRDSMNKKFSNEDLFYFLDQCLLRGLRVRIMFIAGYYSETDEDFEETITLIRRLARDYKKIVHRISVGTTLWLPIGSDIYNQREELGIEMLPADNPFIENWRYRDNTLNKRLIRHQRMVEEVEKLELPMDNSLKSILPKIINQVT